MKYYFIIFLLLPLTGIAQNIGNFISVNPVSQNSDFVIPSTHTFQSIISRGDALTQGGTLPGNTDFTGYVPIDGSSENGYLSINAENVPGAVSILDINFNSITKLWSTSLSASVDFSSVALTIANCSGTVTPWNTIISCEEYTSKEIANQYGFPLDSNADGYDDLGWAVEINPETKTVIDKRWALGNFKHENLVIHNNKRTAYQGADAAVGYLYKFVADAEQDLSSGKLYVYKGSKNGPGNWILLNNTTKEERNTTVNQSTAVGATVFNGIEDVEIGPDGSIYFAVKSEDQVYRFQDSDPISGTTVINMETYVGNTTYNITHTSGTTSVNWGYGNDNLAFDNDGNLWVLNDGENNYIWVVKNGHTQTNPKVEVFGIVPAGAEPTGITFSPDYRFLFMSIQHPNGSNSSTTQTDASGTEIAFDKDTSIVIALNSNLGATTEYTWYLDADGDGYAIPPTVISSNSPGQGYTQSTLPLTDCNDNDPNVFEVTTWYLDSDGDNYAVAPTIESCNSPGTGYTQNILPLTDCNDNDPNVFEVSTWYLDADGDGHATGISVQSCASPGTGYIQTVISTNDCNDNDPNVFEATTWYLDSDGDGYAVAPTMQSCNSPGPGYTQNVLPLTDCDDTNPNIYEVSTWYMDADGDNYAVAPTVESCDSPGTGYTKTILPLTDCNDNDPNVFEVLTWYLDADGDGHAVAPTIQSCNSPGIGYNQNILPLTDCDDTNPNIFEVSTWYLDADGDGHATGISAQSCASPGTGYVQMVTSQNDCDDTNPNVFEVSTWYLDQDGDGYAVAPTIQSCNSPGSGYTQNILPLTDCDDNDPNVFEVSTWYLDADGDGHATGISVQSCASPGTGYVQMVTSQNDCDDTNPNVFEVSTWYLDEDGDGYTTSETIESCKSPGIDYILTPSDKIDCDDENEQINPETIWRLDADEDGTADNEEFIVDCISPGALFTNNILVPYSISDKIIAYPNPTTETIIIDLGEIKSIIELTLVNSSKKLVLTKNFQGQRFLTIDLSTLASGVYFVEIISQEDVIGTHKIIKL